MTCKMLCLIKGQSGFVSLAAYPISTVVSPWSEQCIIMHLPALYGDHILPYIKSFNIQQVVMFLVETILSLHVEDFQPTFFVERKYIGNSFSIWDILLLIKGQYGLVSLATYPISPLSVIDLSSESICTCLCSIKAPDGIFCLFEKLYHVLLRLSVGVVCDVLYFFSTPCQVMVQLLLQIFVQASCHWRFACNWCSAHLNAVLELGTCAVIAVHISHKVCV